MRSAHTRRLFTMIVFLCLLWPASSAGRQDSTRPAKPDLTFAANAPIFTATEDFAAYTGQDLFETTADWNIFDGVLTLPRAPGPTEQVDLSMAIDATGDSYIAWTDNRNGTDGDIYAQKFDREGRRLWRAAIRVNSDSGMDGQFSPTVVLDAAGDLSIIWSSGPNEAPSIYAQKLNTNGDKLWTTDKRVDHGLTNGYPEPAAVRDPATGDIVVVWDDRRNGNADIYAQRLTADGSSRWPDDKRVNTDSSQADQLKPTVGVNAAGNVYVAWVDTRNSGTCPTCPSDMDIYAQKLNPAGVPLWADRRLTSTATGGGFGFGPPAIAVDAASNSYVGWKQGAFAVLVQKLDVNGHKQWEKTPVGSTEGYFAGWPAMILGDDGDLFISWSAGPVGGTYDIYAQKLSQATGDRLWQSELRVNSYTSQESRWGPTLARHPSGDIRIAWSDARGATYPYQGAIHLQSFSAAGMRLWARDVRANSDTILDHYLATAEARSLGVDQISGNIPWATLTVSSTLPVGAAVTYFLSNNGGANWAEVTPGEPRIFETSGSDLRWRAVLHAGIDQTQTPVIDWLQIKYSTDPDPPNTVRVHDENGTPVAGAEIYHNGRFVGKTNSDGVIRFGALRASDTLAALQLVDKRATERGSHNPDSGGNVAFRVYRTSLPVDERGEIREYVVPLPDQQHLLTISSANILVLFNLVVSVEWDANMTYLADVAMAMKHAAAFLYDATDGQMTFGSVAIYDKAQNWADADIQISAKNVVQPHAHIGGITDSDHSHLIRVGRAWNGASGNQGKWSEPNGFRTLVHEFGHYGLGLYDEYFGYKKIGDQLADQVDAFCTGPENRPSPSPTSDASIMDYHYNASELADVGRWSTWCQQTAQHQLNHGEADWQTLTRRYQDGPGQNRWRLVTPDQRAGAGKTIPGPSCLPSALPFPQHTFKNAGVDPKDVELIVHRNGAPYPEQAWITLYYDGKAMDQGLTNEDGQITILGAREGNMLRAVSLDGTLAGSTVVTRDVSLNLAPIALMAQSQGGQPYLRLWPTTSGDQLDGLRLVVTHTLPNDKLTYSLTGSDRIGPSGSIFYDPSKGDHRVQVSFVPAALSGQARVLGVHTGQQVDINVDYRLQQVTNISDTHLFSNDGNLMMHLTPGSLPLNKMYFLIASPWGSPGAPPAGREIVGDVYEVTASGVVTDFTQPAVLRLRYDQAAGSAFAQLGIYRWDNQAGRWQALPSYIQADRREVVTTITTLGTYALIGIVHTSTTITSDKPGSAGTTGDQSFTQYLPIIMNSCEGHS